MRSALAALLVLFAAALPGAAQVPTTAPSAKPPPTLSGTLGTGGLGGSLAPMGTRPALQGLAAVGDPAPQCRAGCTQARITCDGDENDCVQRWRQCLATCRPQSR